MIRSFYLFLMLVLSAGCAKEREQSPPALDDMAHALFRDWENPRRTGKHVAQLSDWLATDGQQPEAWEGLLLTNLLDEDVADTEFPATTRLTRHVGLATSGESGFPVRAHAALIIEPDQTWTDPRTFEQYDRIVTEGDPEAFVNGEDLVRTDNIVRKSGAFGIEIPYTMRKDYRWVEVDKDRDAVVARGWITEAGCSPNGKNCVKQSWTLEVFLEDGDRTLRLYAVWLEVKTQADKLLSRDARIGLMANGSQDILDATEEELAG